MKLINGVDQAKVSQSVVATKSGSMMKRLATSCLLVSLGIVAIAGQPVLAEESHLGGYTLEDRSMRGHYGDLNDDYVAVSKVDVSKAKMSADKKKQMPKKDSRLGAFSAQDNAMLGRYGDKDDGY
jgi:hypothetical protein